MGGDILACITGGIADAFYGGVPDFIGKQSLSYLDVNLREITEQFMQKYCKINVGFYNLRCDLPINYKL